MTVMFAPLTSLICLLYFETDFDIDSTSLLNVEAAGTLLSTFCWVWSNVWTLLVFNSDVHFNCGTLKIDLYNGFTS